MIGIISPLIVFVAALIFILNWQKQNYWKSRGVPTPPFWPLIGHLYKLFIGKRWETIDEQYYMKFKDNGYFGVYEGTKPVLYVTDPSLIRHIMVKDADHFIDRRPITVNSSGTDKILKEMLTLLKGEEWKSLRAIMTPAFTTGKIKAMFPLIAEKGDDLVVECEKIMKQDGYVEMKSILSYYSMDVIASCAFGFEARSIQTGNDSEFMKAGIKMAALNLKNVLIFLVLIISPKLFKTLKLTFSGKESEFLVSVVHKTITNRKESGVRRGDFLDIMLEALEEEEKNKSNKYPVTINTIIAESVLFLLAGFDTTANTLSFVTYLLAKNPETQSRLREELTEVIERDGKLNYQNVMEAPYLDACLSETLRLYAPLHMMERNCTKSYRLPDSELDIPVDMLVGVPTWSVHRDPEYWEDPLAFVPDRFLPENKRNIKPYTYFPFGLGPRNCIGMRFAQLEAKLAIAELIINFELKLRPGFKEMVLASTQNILRANKDGVQLVLKKIDPKK